MASDSPVQDFRYLGKDSPVRVDDLDVLPLSGPVDVRFHSEELTAICPVTGQPDFYRIDIDLAAATVTIESKSLKLYLRTWDGVGILAEELAIAIADRVALAVAGRAEAVVVTVVQGRRGGIDTTVTARR